MPSLQLTIDLSGCLKLWLAQLIVNMLNYIEMATLNAIALKCERDRAQNAERIALKNECPKSARAFKDRKSEKERERARKSEINSE